MSELRPQLQHHVLDEATISNMEEIAALAEVLERKGLCTKTSTTSSASYAARTLTPIDEPTGTVGWVNCDGPQGGEVDYTLRLI